MTVPNQFANVTTTIPLSQLDANFNTPITLGNTAIQLGNTVTTLNNMTFANVTITSVSTPITAAQGGTGLSTLASNNVLLGNGTGTVQVVAPGSAGNVLTSTGTTWTSNAASSLAVTSFSAGTTGFTPNSATQGAVTLAGTLATTNGGTGLTSFTANGVLYASSTSALTTGSAFTFDGSGAVISVNSATDALRITQTGAGNALVVEDSANPDSTPFVVDANGTVIAGATAAYSTSGILVPVLNATVLAAGGGIGLNSWVGASTGAANFQFMKSRGATAGSYTIVNDGDSLGIFRFSGSDGAQFISAATITAAVDGTPGTNDMPGRLVFSTTADGASTPTERMRIRNDGNIGIGAAGSALAKITCAGELTTSSNNSQTIRINSTIPSTTTGAYWSNLSVPITDAASFTLGTLYHFSAEPPALGAGSSVTNQFGFHAGSGMTTATNNYGFYSNIASGTGRWNFYANGTADNYFGGAVGIGGTAAAGVTLQVSKNATGSTNTRGVTSGGTIQSDSTASYNGFRSSVTTAAASFTLADLSHFVANQNTLGAGSTVTAQYGFNASSTLTGATNNYGFYSNIASGTGRWNFYANGTAANYFAGDMQLDKTVTAAGTTGAQTINKNAGTVNFAAAATSLVVTNNRVTANSIIICTVGTNDTTMKSVSAVAGAGSFTLHANAAATAETRVNFLIIN